MTRVLIADDNAIFREVLRRHVTSLFGFAVVEAENGLEAVALAETVHPDLILLDLVMPGIDGIEAIRRIRAIPALADVPIIFLSAETDRCVWAEALSAGANDFMPKPYHRQELAARISLHLKLASLGQELRRQNDLLTRERYLAGCVQRQLLPKDLDFPGIESAVVYQAQEQIGGDFYEAWDDGAAVNVVMADISGHGGLGRHAHGRVQGAALVAAPVRAAPGRRGGGAQYPAVRTAARRRPGHVRDPGPVPHRPDPAAAVRGLGRACAGLCPSAARA